MLDHDGRPIHLDWRYDRAELIADGTVHAIGLVFAFVALAGIVVVAAGLSRVVEITSLVIYGAGLLTVLAVSALYNMWPVSPAKWMLRRFDHAGIFILIAATYMPFLSQVPRSPGLIALVVVIWLVALAGVVLKLALPGRYDRLAVLLYLALGWSGLFAYDLVVTALPGSTLALIVAGGLVFSAGTIFHLWRSLRFHNAVWHAFVLVGCICHYGAVLDCLAGERLAG